MDPTGMERCIFTLPAIVEDPTLPKTNIAPEKLPSQNETCLLVIYFQVLQLLVSGRAILYLSIWNHYLDVPGS